MTDIMARVQETVTRALEADVEVQEAEKATRADSAARQQAASDARAKARQQARQAVWDAGRSRRRNHKPLPSDQGKTALSSARAIMAGRIYDTNKAVVLAANSPEWLASPQVGDWAAMKIPHVLYRGSEGSYFERFHQRLTRLTQRRAMDLYGKLPYKVPFSDAFPGLELVDA